MESELSQYYNILNYLPKEGYYDLLARNIKKDNEKNTNELNKILERILYY